METTPSERPPIPEELKSLVRAGDLTMHPETDSFEAVKDTLGTHMEHGNKREFLNAVGQLIFNDPNWLGKDELPAKLGEHQFLLVRKVALRDDRPEGSTEERDWHEEYKILHADLLPAVKDICAEFPVQMIDIMGVRDTTFGFNDIDLGGYRTA